MIRSTPRYDPVTPDDIRWAGKLRPTAWRPVGSYWRPLDLGQFQYAVRCALTGRGWGVDNPDTVVWYGGRNVVESVTVQGTGWDWGVWKPCFGWAAGNSLLHGIHFYGGCRCLCDDSVIVLHKWTTSKRQTKWLDLYTEIEEAVDQWADRMTDLPTVGERLSRLQPADGHVAQDLLYHAGRNGLTAKSRTYQADKIYQREPGKSAWALLAAFGKASRKDPPGLQMENAYRFYKSVEKTAREGRFSRVRVLKSV